MGGRVPRAGPSPARRRAAEGRARVFGQATYLVVELAWGLPVIALQWGVGAAGLAKHWRTLAVTTVLATAYLSAADALAIRWGIWRLAENRTLGWSLAGLPLEEALFFLLTTLMVVQGFLLVGIETPRARPSLFSLRRGQPSGRRSTGSPDS